MPKRRDPIKLTTTPWSRFRWRASGPLFRMVATVTAAALVTGAGAWQWEAISSFADSSIVAVFGDPEAQERERLAAEEAEREAGQIADARVVLAVSTTKLEATIAASGTVQQGDRDRYQVVLDRCRKAQNSDKVRLDPLTRCITDVAVATGSLEEKLADTITKKAAADAAAKAAADAAAAQAAAAQQAAAEEAARQAAASGGGGGGGDNGGGGGGSVTVYDSISVTCTTSATVTFSVTGSGTLSMSISGPASGSTSGSGSISKSVSGGPGTYTMSASATGGSIGSSSSWSGACG